MDGGDPSSYFFLSIATTDFGITFWIEVLSVLLLLFSSALFSGSEVAFFSLTPEEKQQLEDGETPTMKKAWTLLNSPKDLLAIILISNNFVNIAIVLLTSYIFLTIYPPTTGSELLRSILEVVVITFVILLIGEVIPKVYANKNRMKLVRLMASPLTVIGKTPPFSWLRKMLVNGTAVIVKHAKIRHVDISTDELEEAIALTKPASFTEDEQKMLQGIINFGNTDVRQIMRSRVDTIAIDDTMDYEEVMEVVLESGYSRLPVYKETFDNVIGFLFVKDLLGHLDEDKDFDWKSVVRPPFFVPENKKIDDLLREFQEKKLHMAVVVDEYGGSSGVVTMEDVLEEIIGEITDEFDEEEIGYTKIDHNTFIFEGKTSLVDMYKVLDIDGKEFEEAKGESDSIAGFLIEHSGKILRNNEEYTYHHLKFIVTSSDKKRIRLVKIIKLNANEDE